MKKLRFLLIIILLSSGSLFFSCNKFLEVETLGKTTFPNLFTDVDGFRTALSGTYGLLYNFYSSEFYFYPDVAGNMMNLTTTTVGDLMVSQFNYTSDPEEETGAVGYIWRKGLEVLANTNNIIEYYPEASAKFPNSKSELDNILGQALFIRAICHFDLCRSYAQPYNFTSDASHLGVPILLKLPSIEENPKRASVKEVYNQVITDLKKAISLLSDIDNKYLVTKKAAQALLARVFLYAENWDEAISYSTEVINNSNLSKGNDYLAMYNGMIAGTEAIFRLNGTLKQKTLGNFYTTNSPKTYASDSLIGLFKDANDIRLQLFIKDNLSKGYCTKKYKIDVSYTANTERYDPIVLRASEMYLIRSEAYLKKNNINNALSDLKIIIGRALNKDSNEVIVSYSNENDLFKRIREERNKEFCFEGHCLFDITRYKEDLVRSSTSTSRIKFLKYPNDYFVLPIPQSELNTNINMVGNPTVNR